MALHTLNYRHTLLLLQPTEGESERERERLGHSKKGEREAARGREEGREIVRSEVSIFGNSCLHFNPTFLSVPRSVYFQSCAIIV